MVGLRYLVLLTLLVSVTVVNAANVNVSVYPDPPNVEESFRLVFSTAEKLDGEPDFSPLEGIFEIVGRNQNTQVQWVNGKHSATTRWELEVIALKAGDLVIPAIKFGTSSSSPTSLTVEASGTTGMIASDDLLLEIDVDDATPYVQQQVILTIRLLRRITIADAKLTEPATSGDVIMKTLSKDRTYQDDRNGKQYEVFERRFVLYPQASGKLDIASFTVTAQVPRGSRSLFDPFRSSTTTRRVRSNAIQLDVQPVPAEFTGKVWLPAKKLRLREEWEPQDHLVLNGEPATRTLFLWSEGLTAGQLPDFPLLDVASTTVYPDQVQTREQEVADGYTAIKQQKFAIITKFPDPQSDAKIDMPAIEIPWWNLETDQMEVASLPAKSLQVTFDESQNSQAPPVTAAPIAQDIDTPARGESEIILTSTNPGIWKVWAILASLGWLITAIVFGVIFRGRMRHTPSKRAKETSVNPKMSRLEKDVAHAASSNDPYSTRQALLLWGQHALPDANILSLGQLADRVNTTLGNDIRLLNDYFYARTESKWDGESLKISFKNNTLQPPSTTPDTPPGELAPLFRLN